ncbi:hypothetical protein [Tateyamaria pelophila]|uniref:hypothetical protein n=1 Tax=Tateyamaria pelophila TaxID=328415 RepID=UPI001CC16302|nr:hypothetical protein [Tateyamaria pelophila]
MRWLMIFPFCLTACGLPPAALEPGADGRETIASETGADGTVSATANQGQVATGAVRGPLGRTVASLGDAAEPGLWLKTPLVAVEGPGRVTYPATGRNTSVTLIPIDGPATAGSRLSLQAMQALGASLTGLPEIEVSAGI